MMALINILEKRKDGFSGERGWITIIMGLMPGEGWRYGVHDESLPYLEKVIRILEVKIMNTNVDQWENFHSSCYWRNRERENSNPSY